MEEILVIDWAYVRYAMKMMELYLTVNDVAIRQRHCSYVRPMVEDCVANLNALAEQQRRCPNYWYNDDVDVQELVRNCRRLMNKINKKGGEMLTNEQGLRIDAGARRLRLRMLQPDSEMLMATLAQQLLTGLTNLGHVLNNPSGEALRALYADMLAELDYEICLTDDVEEHVERKKSRCTNGRPQAATIRGWMAKLRQDAESQGMEELFSAMEAAPDDDELHEAVAREIYNFHRNVEAMASAMTLALYYQRFREELSCLEGEVAKKETAEEPLPGVVVRLNGKLRGMVEEGSMADMERFWSLLWADAYCRKRLQAPGQSMVQGVNMAAYCRVVGRLCSHGWVENNFTRLSNVLFEGMEGCNADTLRREMGRGYDMGADVDAELREAVDLFVEQVSEGC